VALSAADASQQSYQSLEARLNARAALRRQSADAEAEAEAELEPDADSTATGSFGALKLMLNEAIQQKFERREIAQQLRRMTRQEAELENEIQSSLLESQRLRERREATQTQIELSLAPTTTGCSEANTDDQSQSQRSAMGMLSPIREEVVSSAGASFMSPSSSALLRYSVKCSQSSPKTTYISSTNHPFPSSLLRNFGLSISGFFTIFSRAKYGKIVLATLLIMYRMYRLICASCHLTIGP
jgi:hypothetical protein